MTRSTAPTPGLCNEPEDRGVGYVLAVACSQQVDAVVGVVVMAAGRGGRKTALPFGPFMIAGGLLAVRSVPGGRLGTAPSSADFDVEWPLDYVMWQADLQRRRSRRTRVQSP